MILYVFLIKWFVQGNFHFYSGQIKIHIWNEEVA